MDNTVIPTAWTHGGKFHADDVFSAALLTILHPDIEIRRGFAVPEEFDGLVFDIGGGAFDHHQADAPVRDNGVPYAAFGLLWKAFGDRLLEPEEAARFDERFVQPLDLDDNTGCGHPLAAVIRSFNPPWDGTDDPDACFSEAVEVARAILEKRLEEIRGLRRAREVVEPALAAMQDGIVVLPRYAPWKKVLIPSPAEFVVYPSQRGGYNAQVVPCGEGDGAAKCPFPADWAGKSADALQKMTGLPSLTFCHNGRFLIAADRREDALQACRLAQRSEAQESRRHQVRGDSAAKKERASREWMGRWIVGTLAALLLVLSLAPMLFRAFHEGVYITSGVFAAVLAACVWYPTLKKAVTRWWQKTWARRLLKGLMALVAVLLVLFLAVSGILLYGAARPVPENATVIVLGASVIEDRPCRMLADRLDAAVRYLEENPASACIVSGGQGPDEQYTEASVMKAYLIERGIDSSRIWEEDRSTNTSENIRFSKQIIEEQGLSDTVVIATQEFHQYRAQQFAKKAGLEQAGPCTCRTPWYLLLGYWVREFAAVSRMVLLGY